MRPASKRLSGRCPDASDPSAGPYHPVVRAEIARSNEPTGVLAKRYGTSDETVRKWRKRGTEGETKACHDRSSRPQRLAWRATEEERTIVCQLRRSTGFGLDELAFVVRHFLPHLNRDSIWRILRAEGLSRRPPVPKPHPVRDRANSMSTTRASFISM